MSQTPRDLCRAVYAALDRVADPCSIATGVPVGLVEMGLVAGLDVVNGIARVTLRLTSPICWQSIHIVEAAERCVLEVDGIREVEVEVDHSGDWTPEFMSPGARARLRTLRPLTVTQT